MGDHQIMKLHLFFLFVAVGAAPCNENQQCASCEEDGKCTAKCYSGYYSFKCNHRCSLGCRNNICKLDNNGNDECTEGCKLGFYGKRCTVPCTTNLNTCNRCPQECEGGFCQLGLSCARGCQDSYYGNTCKSCPAGCEVCNRVSGTCEVCLHCEGNCTHGCLEGCKAGYFGKFCEDTCKFRCLSGCDQTSGDCFKCNPGWFGASCENQCPNRCSDEECDINGVCTLGCTQGWFGPRCDNECLPSCVGDRCDRNGKCIDGCKLGFHGEQCQNMCPEFCFNKLCDVEDGSCKSCKKSYHGSHCNNSCVGCIDGACSQHTGHCIQGCLSSYRGEFCQHNCTGDCDENECREVCKTNPVIKNVSEGDVTSNFIPYIVAAVVVVIVSALVTYAACRFKRLQSVIYGNRKEGQGHQLRVQRDSTENAPEPNVNFYCEIDDHSETPQVPRRCGTAGTASPQTSSKNRHEGTTNNSNTVMVDDRLVHSRESASLSQAEQNGDVTIHSDENEVNDVSTDLVLHGPARPNSYLTAFAPYIANINVPEVGRINVPIIQGKAVGSNTRPQEMIDIETFTSSHESCLSVPNIYAKASGFDAGPSNVKTETRNDRDALTNALVKAQGVDEVPLLNDDKTEPQQRSSPDSIEYSRAQRFCTDTSQNSEDAEVDEKISNISVPVIADCYDNFSVDDDEEAIPNPPPDNYTKLFANNHAKK